ncbi:tRNA lysidine(34) synthetase TilS [Malacoplasma penetrans]|uniref:tRNA(Ile)-lysidine synthase n=1 Tax=Malacoplasma penetrans (strain HF-2) TaxID=272633 RepID=TILS_MALP2|nr:tRNA lysidine(34) synthetase TilS [Malacoplasma penetrans]Q8EWQ7.1 RecName: Full=tRNA(Ile)-lysidine synthase; AltName: Full=tRNA(Ile)-2-lysyl-cytidine synthase; AltName: Full=tRNA(Ile)-lysidine synthetase [Malacoplasma penetrans HF-2]RXY97000.1 tRNA lysidine(34) synthetase TilS [Malacoplasma penetrans]BAC43937.1 predicted cell cycle protein MesJ [Malacoplasma penetrans HF-2]
MKHKYLIAVSGGPDSMALLNKKRHLVEAVCHVNYHDREDSDNDEKIVRDYCKKYNLKLFVFDTHKDDVSKYKDINNLQTWYREIRYDFFEKISQELGIKKILIAHQKNDFLESAYMSLNKNKKNLFLGIRRKSKFRSLILIRPLLNKTKKSLEQYCRSKNIEFVIDYTNFWDRYSRNVVRKMMAEWDKKTFQKFYLKVKWFNLKNMFFIKLLDSKFNNWIKQDFDINYFLKIKNNYKESLIYLFLNHIGIKPNENKIEQIIEFINKNKNGSVKKYRLKENQFIEIKNKKILYSIC